MTYFFAPKPPSGRLIRRRARRPVNNIACRIVENIIANQAVRVSNAIFDVVLNERIVVFCCARLSPRKWRMRKQHENGMKRILSAKSAAK